MVFKYRGRSSEAVSRRAKQQSGIYDSYVSVDALWFKAKEGENIIRILPWISGTNPKLKDEEFSAKWGDHWGIDIFIHRNIGPDNGTYLCSEKMNGTPCPICAARAGADEEEAQTLKPQNRILCWLVDRNDEKAGPKLWSMPLGTSKDISARSTVKGSGELLLIDDPEEGFDIFFDREGEKARTRYNHVEVDREPSSLHKNEKTQNKWLAYAEDNLLPEILEFYEADYLEKILSGQIERDDESASDRGSRRGRRGEEDKDGENTTRRSRGRDADQEEAGDEKPARRSRSQGNEEEGGESETLSRSRRRGREEEENLGEKESPRGSRHTRGHSEEEETAEADAEAESENEGREARASTRRSRRGDDADEEAEEKAEPKRGERYRSSRDEPADEAETTVAAAKGRLRRVGTRR